MQEILDAQKDNKNTEDFIQQIKFNVFQDRIFVFTPKGDVYDLPRNATPVDFAYAVHTDIGHHCVGVMINDRINKLDTALKSGDTVEIITDKNKKPSRDWMKIAKTSRAREKIKQALKEGGGFMKFIKWK